MQKLITCNVDLLSFAATSTADVEVAIQSIKKKTNNEVAIATIDLIGYSHPKARYFPLLRQKKVSKEKAARLPLLPALLGFVGGRRGKRD